MVPGHGPVMRTWEYVDTLLGLLHSVVDQVLKAVEQRLSLEETRKKVNIEVYEKEMAGDTFYRKRAFEGAFIQPAIERAYLEAKFAEERGT